MTVILSTEQIDKIGNTVVYLSSRVSELTKTKLLKILFLLEENSIKKYGKPFFGLDFKVWQFGPVVEPIYKEVDEGKFEIFKNYLKKNPFDEIEGISDFVDDEFSQNDLNLIDEMVLFAKHKTPSNFVHFTHKSSSLWRKAAIKYGILEELESGRMPKTDYSIDFFMLFEGDEENPVFEKYKSSLENAAFSKNFKELRIV